jgi:excisionase family DNA binding protein
MMTKAEAAEYLGVTIRSIEGYAAKGRLTPAKAKGSRGDITVYDEKEIEKLKREREEVVFMPHSQQPHKQSLALSSTRSLPAVQQMTELVKLLDGARTARPSIGDLAAKPLLKLDEACELTGLSRQTLREAIEAGTLKAQIIGRAWRVKRDDLNRYLKNL